MLPLSTCPQSSRTRRGPPGRGRLVMSPARLANSGSACPAPRGEAGTAWRRACSHRGVHGDGHPLGTLPGTRQCTGAALACQRACLVQTPHREPNIYSHHTKMRPIEALFESSFGCADLVRSPTEPAESQIRSATTTITAMPQAGQRWIPHLSLSTSLYVRDFSTVLQALRFYHSL
jgi:hypothetical protein